VELISGSVGSLQRYKKLEMGLDFHFHNESNLSLSAEKRIGTFWQYFVTNFYGEYE